MHEAYLNIAKDLDEQLLLLHNKLIMDLIYTILLIITTALNISSNDITIVTPIILT